MREKQKRKYLILSVVVGALWVCFLLFISMNVSASEADKPPEQQNHETVQDEQPESAESLLTVGEPELIAAHEQPELPEQEQELVQVNQTEFFMTEAEIVELATSLLDSRLENIGYTYDSYDIYNYRYVQVQNIFGALNIFYTPEQLYEYCTYLQKAIDRLELLPTEPPDEEPPEDSTNPTDFEYILVGLFAVVGSVAGSAFMNKWQMGV